MMAESVPMRTAGPQDGNRARGGRQGDGYGGEVRPAGASDH